MIFLSWVSVQSWTYWTYFTISILFNMTAGSSSTGRYFEVSVQSGGLQCWKGHLHEGEQEFSEWTDFQRSLRIAYMLVNYILVKASASFRT